MVAGRIFQESCKSRLDSKREMICRKGSSRRRQVIMKKCSIRKRERKRENFGRGKRIKKDKIGKGEIFFFCLIIFNTFFDREKPTNLSLKKTIHTEFCQSTRLFFFFFFFLKLVGES